MRKKLLFLVGLLCATWSGNAWGQQAVEFNLDKDNCLELISENGYTSNGVTFKLTSNDLDLKEEKKYLSTGGLNKNSKTATLTISTNHKIITYNSANYAAASRKPMMFGGKCNCTFAGGSAVDVVESVTDPADASYNKIVTAGKNLGASNPLTFVRTDNFEYAAYIGKMYFKITLAEEYKFTATATNKSGNSFGTATASIASSVLKNLGTGSATTQATFTATPNSGYRFLGWKANESDAGYVSTDATYKVDVTNNAENSTVGKTLYAYFEAKELTLEQNVNNTIEAGYYKKVTINRALPAGYAAVCLPFDYTPAQGKIYQLTSESYENDNLSLAFSSGATKIEAGKPYIVNGVDVSSIVANDVNVIASPETENGSVVDFIGTFNPVTLQKNDIFVSNSNGPLKYLLDESANMNGYRAYLRPASNVVMGSNKAISFSFDDTLTGIMTVNGDILVNDAPIYNIKGQRVSDATQPGIYVQNGRKFIVK